MNGNTTFRYDAAGMLSVVTVEADIPITSDEFDDRMEPVRTRLHLPRGTLQRIAGVEERRVWAEEDGFRQGAIRAGKEALDRAGVEPGQIDLLINTSVSRHHLEPSVAVGLHAGIGLPSSAMNFDITNACLGFINGLTLAANMIQAGQIRYALIVNAEDMDSTHRDTITRLNEEATTREEFNERYAALTLGSGAAAAVVGPLSGHPDAHAITGAAARSASQHYELCVGSFGDMRTDTTALLDNGLQLIMDCWDAAHLDGWSWRDVDMCVTHQVSAVYSREFAKRSGIPLDRLPMTFPFWGNVGPASVPMTLAREADQGHLSAGDRVLLLGVGSGLNTTLMEIIW